MALQALQQLSMDSQFALQAKEQQIERFSRESQAALQAKELQIERFSAESQTALRGKEEQLQLTVRNLQNTLSWRITAPLRRLSALLGSSRT